MERVEVTRKVVVSKVPPEENLQKFAEHLLTVLPMDDSSLMVYPGDGTAADRTGLLKFSQYHAYFLST